MRHDYPAGPAADKQCSTTSVHFLCTAQEEELVGLLEGVCRYQFQAVIIQEVEAEVVNFCMH